MIICGSAQHTSLTPRSCVPICDQRLEERWNSRTWCMNEYSSWMAERIIGGRVSRVESYIGSVHVALTRFHRAGQVSRVRRYQRLWNRAFARALRAAVPGFHDCRCRRRLAGERSWNSGKILFLSLPSPPPLVLFSLAFLQRVV